MGLSWTPCGIVTSVLCLLQLPIAAWPTAGWVKLRVCPESDVISCADDHHLVFADVTAQCPARRELSDLYREIAELCYGRSSCVVDPIELLANNGCQGRCVHLDLACINPLRIHGHGANIKDRWGILHSPNYPVGGATMAVVSSTLSPQSTPTDTRQEVTLLMYHHSLATNDTILVCGIRFLTSERGCEEINMATITTAGISISRIGGIQVITVRQLGQTEFFIMEYRFKDTPASEVALVFTNITLRTTTAGSTTTATEEIGQAGSTTTAPEEIGQGGRLEEQPVSRSVIIGVSVGAAVLLLVIILAVVVTCRILQNDKNEANQEAEHPAMEYDVYIADVDDGKEEEDLYVVTPPPACSTPQTAALQAAAEQTAHPDPTLYMDGGGYDYVGGAVGRGDQDDVNETSTDHGPPAGGSDESVLSEDKHQPEVDVRGSTLSMRSDTSYDYSIMEVDGYAVVKKKQTSLEPS